MEVVSWCVRCWWLHWVELLDAIEGREGKRILSRVVGSCVEDLYCSVEFGAWGLEKDDYIHYSNSFIREEFRSEHISRSEFACWILDKARSVTRERKNCAKLVGKI